MSIQCKSCCDEIPEEKIWVLKFMGFFCAPCAVAALEYWEEQAPLALRKVKARTPDTPDIERFL